MAEPASGDELYGLDPEQFTAFRTALAKELRAEGHREEAARVAKLRKPSVTAWAVNMVAREQPELVTNLLDAGTALRAAVEDALGGDPSAMREAQVAERRAADAVVDAGAGYLRAAGRPAGDAARKRMASTLRAAVVDPSAAGPLRAGVLDADLDAPGFGLDALSADAAKTSSALTASPRAPTAGQQNATPEDADRIRARQLRAEADEAEQRAREAERSAAAAERRAHELRSAAAEAQTAAEQAVRRAETLSAEATDAESVASAERATAVDTAARAIEIRRRAGQRG